MEVYSFNFQFLLVWELNPHISHDLQPIVLRRIVAGSNHYATLEPPILRQKL